MGGEGEAPGRWRRAQCVSTVGLMTICVASFGIADAMAAPRAPRAKTERAAEPAERKPQGPLQIVVSLGQQRLFVYDSVGLLTTSTVSTGTGGYPTPSGVFAVLDKERQHLSNIYGGAPMPYMQRLTMSGVALHAGVVTGRPASHGCIRLPPAFSVQLYKLTGLGARVIIAPDAPVPADIVHAQLPARLPPPPPSAAEPLSALAGAAVDTSAAFHAGFSAARIYAVTAERNALLETLPVSVLVSKHEGKVYVRHGFKPLFDLPAVVREPERPLGTHVFTAQSFTDASETTLRWQVVSLPAEGGAQASRKVSRASRGESDAPLPLVSGPPSTAAEALDRIELAPDARERIARLMSPGASLIVSDHGFNREMRAAGTDFIVLTQH